VKAIHILCHSYAEGFHQGSFRVVVGGGGGEEEEEKMGWWKEDGCADLCFLFLLSRSRLARTGYLQDGRSLDWLEIGLEDGRRGAGGLLEGRRCEPARPLLPSTPPRATKKELCSAVSISLLRLTFLLTFPTSLSPSLQLLPFLLISALSFFRSFPFSVSLAPPPSPPSFEFS